MALWQPHLHDEASRKYLGIVQALESDIYAGRVKPGDRLPSQRAIAEALRVDLTTVTRAFNEARRRGLVEGNKGRGSFIRGAVEKKLISDKQALLDLSMNNPPQPVSANLQQRIPEGIAGLIADQRRMLQLHYQDSAGNPVDREAAAHWLQAKVVNIHADRVLITGGAQSALYAICHHLLKQGEYLATAEYTYPGLNAVSQQLGCQLQAIATDEQGIIPDAFEQSCQKKSIKALYVIPALDNPTTATIPLARRKKIVEIARRYKVAIIEDDPYSTLQTKPIEAFASLLPELTWHIATLSKCATPALRVAFIITPNADDIEKLADVIRATQLMAPPLMCALVTRWIYDGTLDDIAQAIRQENNARQQLAATILKDWTYQADPDGHHLWLALPNNWLAADFASHAEKMGVTIVPSSSFAITNKPIDAVRVSLGLATDLDSLTEALTILTRLLSQTQRLTRAVV
ncbi:aminotransferase-like domain-containing protein [Methylophaga thiooxydans]|uniref:Aminotransferase, classes I and II superfamily n=1 Tax=Methylophaga thiooxydans DMS010 TaxID=637616 RepID=C0N7L4_9GAMM|nr:PLP-dependent aminotransferase family protein [Methylophaga thiooxydans]EEF79223.1 aminotransferase, classes I and II superfamily [Methylophaga thiooxydans DMS010]